MGRYDDQPRTARPAAEVAEGTAAASPVDTPSRIERLQAISWRARTTRRGAAVLRDARANELRHAWLDD